MRRIKMAKKAKKRAEKRRPARAKASKATRAAKTKPARKTKAARTTAKTARPAKKARTVAGVAASRDAELKRLLREERALERDVDNEAEPSALSESPEYIPGVSEDSLAEELGEASVESATSGDQAAENIRDEDLSEEEGGPFVVTPARREFARGTDASNPEDAEPADFPTATRRPK
jgi:RNA polymerase primary sigma factor